jgi:hypothetical protein
MTVFLPLYCPFCELMYSPIIPLNQVFFRHYDDDGIQAKGPYYPCTDCMDNLIHKFQESKHGRYDVLGDKTERVVFTFGAPVAITEEEAEKVMARQDKFNSCLEHKNFQFLDDVLKNGPSIRRKLKNPHRSRDLYSILAKPLQHETPAEEGSECNEVDSP